MYNLKIFFLHFHNVVHSFVQHRFSIMSTMSCESIECFILEIVSEVNFYQGQSNILIAEPMLDASMVHRLCCVPIHWRKK